MSYCTGKNIEIARGKAIKMLVLEYIEVLSGDDIKSEITTRLAIL